MYSKMSKIALKILILRNVTVKYAKYIKEYHQNDIIRIIFFFHSKFFIVKRENIEKFKTINHKN